MRQFRNIFVSITPFIFSSKNYNNARMLVASIMDLVNSTMTVLPPILVNQYFQDSLEDSQTAVASIFGIGLVCNQMLPKFRNFMINRVRANVQKELSIAMVKASYEKELDHHLTERTGEFSQALTKNYSTIDKLIPSFFGEGLPTTLNLSAISATLIALYGPIGFLELGALMLYIVTAIYRESRTVSVRADCVRESYAAYGILIESLGNYQVAHQFGNVDFEIKKVDGALTNSELKYAAQHHADDVNAVYLSAINLLGFIGTIGYTFLVSDIEGINLALVLYLAFQFNTNLNSLAPALSSLHTAYVDSHKIVDFLQRRSKVADSKDPHILDLMFAPSIEFTNVKFKYDSKQVLDGVSFSIQPGQKVAIVGETGAGKSTVVKLLQRFYDYDEGSIKINNLDIKGIQAASLRQHIAVISQDSIIFNDTVFKNIKYGFLEADNKEINEAAFSAKLISGTDDSLLQQSAGERGGKLSGGQKQRTSIARTILKGGVIYLLDEATSSLDIKTETDVQATLDDISRHATTLVITHRLTTIVNADQILYLSKDGQITESGTFSELMEKKGNFYDLFVIQCKELQLDPGSFKYSTQTRAEKEEKYNTQSDFWLKRKQRQHFQPINYEDNELTPLLNGKKAIINR